MLRDLTGFWLCGVLFCRSQGQNGVLLCVLSRDSCCKGRDLSWFRVAWGGGPAIDLDR